MFDSIGSVSICVVDQDRAKDFYVNMLGFELRADVPFGEGDRWLTVAPAGAKTELVLFKPDERFPHLLPLIGKSQLVTLHVQDMRAVHTALVAKSVQFAQEPENFFWGAQATLIDSEGNQIVMVGPQMA
jgi:uncharacterized glyoxalase superfamily protein PhnB